MLQLEIHEGGRIRIVPIADQKIAVGRRPDNDVVLTDDRSSRYHCTLEPMEDSVLLTDLGSRNGTRVNGEKVQSAILSPGDEIRIGQASIRLARAGESDPSSVQVVELVDTAMGEREDDVPMAILEEAAPAPVPAPEGVTAESFAVDLRRLLTAGKNVGFGTEDLALLDPHGRVLHAAGGQGTDRDAVRVLRTLLFGAFRLRATDLHFEPQSQGYQLRFRVDGTMLPILKMPEALGTAVLSVVKVLCEIDIAKKQIVQEGHFSVSASSRHVDYRISFTPTTHGQKLVMRVLDKTVIPETLNDLGLPPAMLRSFRSVLNTDSGMVLVSGPTGSGKTTTLYTAIRELDARARNIVTIEDPVEYHFDGITQIPVDIRQNMSFANLLVSVLRQDPDVILVGEIRDPETARTAMQAAITGHLVFSTLHARDTVSSIFRLIDLGVEPYMVANALSLCVAQRLIRVLCDECKRPYRPSPTQLVKMKMENRGIEKLFAHVGCRQCMGMGYLGRMAIFETLSFNDEIRDTLLTQPTIASIRKAAGQYSFQTLVESGYARAADGATSTEEVERVAMQE